MKETFCASATMGPDKFRADTLVTAAGSRGAFDVEPETSDLDSRPDPACDSAGAKSGTDRAGAKLATKKRIHAALFERMDTDLRRMSLEAANDSTIRQQVCRVLDRLLDELRYELPPDCGIAELKREVLQECLGLGPLEPLLADGEIDEIMVNRYDTIFVERCGKIRRVNASFVDERQLMAAIERIVVPLGRRIDESSPMVDARLRDGSRVNAVIPPLSIDGPCITIRKFPQNPYMARDLVRFGTISDKMWSFLFEAVRLRQNVIISGGTGTGKTTLLNILSRAIPRAERMVTIEDSAELQLNHPNIVRLESRRPNVEGEGEVSIRDLVVNALRMRPDRIIVGECRAGEALDMLQAMNTGHEGSLTTVHANGPRDTLIRLETMVLMAGMELPSRAIREQVASAIDLIVHQSRFDDGSRKVTHIAEITGRDGDVITMQDVFLFDSFGRDVNGRVMGRFVTTGNVPRFVEESRERGDSQLPSDFFEKAE